MPPQENITIDKRDRLLAGRFRALVAAEKLHLHRDLSLWKVSRLLNTNTNSLSCAINKALGKSFSDFFAELRVEESLRIMQSDARCTASGRRLTVEEIARRSGFNDRKSFFRTFKRIKGISPTEYRKMQRQ